MSRWPMVTLGALVRLSLDPHSVEPHRNYLIAGVYGFGRGMISRSPVLGISIAGRQLFRICAGQLIYSKLKAFEGAFAIVGERTDGYFCLK